MDRRRRVLVNRYERETLAALQEASHHCETRVYAKVRVADALDIERSGLSREDYTYALKSHFDFVVCSKDDQVQFAVEFDEPHHDTDPEAIARDIRKNSICERLGLPLLRIDAAFLQRVGRFSLLGWLAEMWFTYEAFEEARSKGIIRADEPFGYELLSSVSAVDGKMVRRSLDPFAASRRALGEYLYGSKRGRFDAAWAVTRRHPDGGSVTHSFAALNDGRVLHGHGRCRAFEFTPIQPSEIAEELGLASLVQQLHEYEKSGSGTLDASEASAIEEACKDWPRQCAFSFGTGDTHLQ